MNSEDKKTIIEGLVYMHPRMFALTDEDPETVLNEDGKHFLSNDELKLWSRVIAGGDKGIHNIND